MQYISLSACQAPHGQRGSSIPDVLPGTLRGQRGPELKGMSQTSVLTNTWKSLDPSHQTRPLLSLLSASTWDAGHQVPSSSDLSQLVAEIRALRGQLERSIQVNNCLRQQLEQQLDSEGGKASLSHSSANQEDPGNKQLLFQGGKDRGTGTAVARGAGARTSVVEGTGFPLPHSLGSG